MGRFTAWFHPELSETEPDAVWINVLIPKNCNSCQFVTKERIFLSFSSGRFVKWIRKSETGFHEFDQVDQSLDQEQYSFTAFLGLTLK